MASKAYNIRSIKDETTAAVVSEMMQNRYPDVKFEAVETGCGYYNLLVWSDTEAHIHPTTLNSFTREAGRLTGIVLETVSILRRDGVF